MFLNFTLPETEETPRVSLDLDPDDVLTIEYHVGSTIITTTNGPVTVMELQVDIELQYTQTGTPPPDGKDRKFTAIGVVADTPIAIGLEARGIASVIGLIDEALFDDDALATLVSDLELLMVDFVKLLMKAYKATDHLPGP